MQGKTSRATPTLRPTQCFWHAHPQLNAMFSKKFHVTYGISIQVVEIMSSNLNLFSSLDKSIQTDVTLGNNV